MITKMFGDNTRKCRALFHYRGREYHLRVPDPYIESRLMRKEDGDYGIDDAYACISLGEPHKDFTYKFGGLSDYPKAFRKAVVSKLIYTIGHSTHNESKLLSLLKQHSVTAVADVRSQPYSRFNPQYNRESLTETLKNAGISYVFLGKELGARSDDPSCYLHGKVQYDRLAKTVLFKRGMERIQQGAARYNVALMCAEKDPLHCHRTILVCRHLFEEGFTVQHILADGNLESHDQSIARLMGELHIPEKDMFRSQEELVADAYEQQGERIAYTERNSATHEVAS